MLFFFLFHCVIGYTCCCSGLVMMAQKRVQPKRVRQGKCYLYVEQRDGTVHRVCVLRVLAATSEQYEVSVTG